MRPMQPRSVAGWVAMGTGDSGSFFVLPTVALDAQCRQGPFRAEAVNGLEHGSPCLLQEILAIEDQGDRDALAGGQNTEGARVLRDHLYFFEDLSFGSAQDRYGAAVPVASR